MWQDHEREITLRPSRLERTTGTWAVANGSLHILKPVWDPKNPLVDELDDWKAKIGHLGCIEIFERDSTLCIPKTFIFVRIYF